MPKKRSTRPILTFTLCYRHNGNEYITTIVDHDAASARARFLKQNPDCTIISLT